MSEIRKRIKRFSGRGEASGLGVEEAGKSGEHEAVLSLGEGWPPEKLYEFRQQWEALKQSYNVAMEPMESIADPSLPILSKHASAALQGRIATEHDMRDALTLLVAQAGSQKAAADSLSVSAAYFGDVLLGRRPVSSNIAERLGWSKVEVFIQRRGNDRIKT